MKLIKLLLDDAVVSSPVNVVNLGTPTGTTVDDSEFEESTYGTDKAVRLPDTGKMLLEQLVEETLIPVVTFRVSA